MSVAVTPHINFRGQAREALELWQRAFGGEVVTMTYAQMPGQDPADADGVIWGQVEAPNGFRIMAYDVQAARPFSRGDAPFYVSVRGTDSDELRAQWTVLAEEGTVLVPLGGSPWSPLYGMLTDRFGITWVMDVAA